MFESYFMSPSALGLLILRLATGITFIVHGWMKLNPNGPAKRPAGFAGWLKQMGVPLPSVLAWIVALLETVGAVLLILGLGTQLIAVGFAIDMAVAILLVKRQMMNAAFMDQKGQGWEFEFALMVQAFALLFAGAGTISLDYALGIVLPDPVILTLAILTVIIIAGITAVMTTTHRAAPHSQPKAA